MTTCCRAPLDPSIMVTVFDPGGGGATAFAASGGLAAASCTAGWAPPPFWSILVGKDDLVATTATGWPPSGSLTNVAQPTTTRPDRPRAPAKICGGVAGSFGSRFPLPKPSGAFRSSGATAADPCESLREFTTRGIHAALSGCQKRSGRPNGRPVIFNNQILSVRDRVLGVWRER